MSASPAAAGRASAPLPISLYIAADGPVAADDAQSLGWQISRRGCSGAELGHQIGRGPALLKQALGQIAVAALDLGDVVAPLIVPRLPQGGVEVGAWSLVDQVRGLAVRRRTSSNKQEKRINRNKCAYLSPASLVQLLQASFERKIETPRINTKETTAARGASLRRPRVICAHKLFCLSGGIFMKRLILPAALLSLESLRRSKLQA